MAFNRCFDNFNNTIKSSSDYSTAQRQKTIYSELAQNLKNGNANPVKANGVTYNDNFGILNSSGSGCLEYAKDYQLLLDVTKGAYLIHNDSTAASAVPYQALTGNLLVVDYSSNGVDVVVDTSYNAGNANKIIFPQTISAHAADLSFNNSYPGVIVDPSYNIFYDECMQGFNSNKNPWLRLSSVGFQTSNLYQQAIKGNPYNNFIYPQKLQIYCETEGAGYQKTYITGYYTITIDSEERSIGGYWSYNGSSYNWTTLSPPILPSPYDSILDSQKSYIAFGISNNISIISGICTIIGESNSLIFPGYWKNNVWTNLIKPTIDATNITAVDVSQDGSIIVGNYSNGTNFIGGYWEYDTNSNSYLWYDLIKPIETIENYNALGISNIGQGIQITGNYIDDITGYTVSGYWSITDNDIILWNSIDKPLIANSTDYIIYDTGIYISIGEEVYTGIINFSIGTPSRVGAYAKYDSETEQYLWTILPSPSTSEDDSYSATGILSDSDKILGNYNNKAGLWEYLTWIDLPNPDINSNSYFANYISSQS